MPARGRTLSPDQPSNEAEHLFCFALRISLSTWSVYDTNDRRRCDGRGTRGRVRDDGVCTGSKTGTDDRVSGSGRRPAAVRRQLGRAPGAVVLDIVERPAGGDLFERL